MHGAACWLQVKIVHQVFQMGFHVIHADSDITWFNDPYPYFKKHIDNGEEPPHMIVSLVSTCGGSKGLPSSGYAFQQGQAVIQGSSSADTYAYCSPWMSTQSGCRCSICTCLLHIIPAYCIPYHCMQDTMDTENAPGENDVEKDITPYQSINTGHDS
jgi:hypothetical protein